MRWLSCRNALTMFSRSFPYWTYKTPLLIRNCSKWFRFVSLLPNRISVYSPYRNNHGNNISRCLTPRFFLILLSMSWYSEYEMKNVFPHDIHLHGSSFRSRSLFIRNLSKSSCPKRKLPCGFSNTAGFHERGLQFNLAHECEQQGMKSGLRSFSRIYFDFARLNVLPHTGHVNSICSIAII